MDFEFILTALTLFTGVIWALDKWWLAPRRQRTRLEREEDKPGAVVDFSRSFFPVILIVLLLRSFLAEPFRIPSGSMIPTLLVGDFILVNKFAYGIRLPVLHTKLVAVGEPRRGDVMVFRYPVDPTKDFIKRVIGLPGDHIAYRDKQLSVNGAPVGWEAAGVYTAPGLASVSVVQRFEEKIGNVRHAVLVNPARSPDDFYDFVVPAGHYFVMGDNRDGSDDSRRWGTVPERNLVGKAFLIWMSWDGARSRPDFARIGLRIH